MSALHQACASGDLATVELILTQGSCDPNQRDEDWSCKSPLHWAAAGGHTEVVQLLLSHGARSCLQTEQGWSAAHFAAQSGRLGVLRVLHVHHAPLDQRDRSGDTARRIAQIYGHKDCATFLLKAESECQAHRRAAALRGIKLDEEDERWNQEEEERREKGERRDERGGGRRREED
ncbi:unnamed protein product [Knipowitschia caucasica]|uniref:Ankyrin repeat domain-containing protein 66 n=1 Tax=Knipowitschia caucasica TaxID=637954 RepID=A0AAV2MG01_KNICA